MRAATGLRLGVRLGGICYHLKHIKIGICLTRKHLPLWKGPNIIKGIGQLPTGDAIFGSPLSFATWNSKRETWAPEPRDLALWRWIAGWKRGGVLCCALYRVCSVFYVFCVFCVYLCAVLCTISPRSHTKTPRWRNSLCPPYWRRDIVTFSSCGIFPLLTHYIWSNQV